MNLMPTNSVEEDRDAPVSRRSAGVMSGRMLKLLRSPETVTVILLLACFAVSCMLSRYFLDAHFLLDSTSLYMETGIMALAMTFIIITGNIDLSVASMLALTGVICGELFVRFHLPMPVVALAAPFIGGLLGLFNGFMITRLRLPSLTVTLGTLALYRGLAQVLAGDHSLSGFPRWFVGIDYRRLGGWLPMPLIVFLVMAILCGMVLHKTTFGRRLYAIGTNEPAARFSGIRVDRLKWVVFAMSGVFAGIGALIMLSRLSVARYDMAWGDELTVITAVVLGGTDIFGGRGTIFGTVMALFLLGIVGKGMGLADFSAENQLAINGTLLVVAVILFRLLSKIGIKR